MVMLILGAVLPFALLLILRSSNKAVVYSTSGTSKPDWNFSARLTFGWLDSGLTSALGYTPLINSG